MGFVGSGCKGVSECRVSGFGVSGCRVPLSRFLGVAVYELGFRGSRFLRPSFLGLGLLGAFRVSGFGV